jgi:hypothetical protein
MPTLNRYQPFAVYHALHEFLRTPKALEILRTYTDQGLSSLEGCGLAAHAISKLAPPGNLVAILDDTNVIRHLGYLSQLGSETRIIDAFAVIDYRSRGKWKAAFEKKTGLKNCIVWNIDQWDEERIANASNAYAAAIKKIIKKRWTNEIIEDKLENSLHTVIYLDDVIANYEPQYKHNYISRLHANLRVDKYAHYKSDETIDIATITGHLVPIEKILEDRRYPIRRSLWSAGDLGKSAYSVLFDDKEEFWIPELGEHDYFLPPDNLLLIERVHVNPKYRGKNLSLQLMKSLLSSTMLPANMLVAIKPYPTEIRRGKTTEDGVAKLTNIVKQLGLAQIGKSGWYYNVICPRFEPEVHQDQRNTLNRAILDLLSPGSTIIVGDEDLAFMVATVLSIDKKGPPRFTMLYHPSIDDFFERKPTSDTKRTQVCENKQICAVRYVSRPHPNPELESWAIFDIQNWCYEGTAENGAVIALEKDELETRMLELAEKLTPNRKATTSL